jgi:hypothetical protein
VGYPFLGRAERSAMRRPLLGLWRVLYGVLGLLLRSSCRVGGERFSLLKKVHLEYSVRARRPHRLSRTFFFPARHWMAMVHIYIQHICTDCQVRLVQVDRNWYFAPNRSSSYASGHVCPRRSQQRCESALLIGLIQYFMCNMASI